ncbi:MAG: V-type ATP synthase subunit A [Deltaproteobacteria bacterium]|nr:V-type ATP synthase subunit A [Deltaproteobacteria bacterium]
MEGRIVSVFGNMVIAETEGSVVKNSVGFCRGRDGASLLCEVIRIRGNRADLQVFEETRGLRVGDRVEFRPEMLSATLGPGLLGQIYDGLQKPLPPLAEKIGYFLTPGSEMPALDANRTWEWTPRIQAGDTVSAGDALGSVPESIFDHPIMVPFQWAGEFLVKEIMAAGSYTIDDPIAVLADQKGELRHVRMQQTWPVKRPLLIARRRLRPTEPLVTRVRIIDSMFPVVRGGTYCIPGPFGAGKTILQQVTSRNAEVDIVIITACGERAGEVVETIREFPKLEDPRTGKSLMERTIIVCNTSAMPVAARDASVYTGITLAEYYRQAGLDVLFLADSTSRWAQAMREISGRLEEIPGEEAFPAYLESRIAGFYERAGIIELRNGKRASVTIGGTVSPAGGNFDEPVTQATLKVVGAFHGLSRERSDARRYPAIDPMESWTKYEGIIDSEKVNWVRSLLQRGDEVRQMITVVGEEGTPIDDFTQMLKADFFDAAYLQQNAFDAVDGATPRERQQFVFDKIFEVLRLDFGFTDKDRARDIMVRVSSLFRDWNYLAWDPSVVSQDEKEGGEGEPSDFEEMLAEIDQFMERKGGLIDEKEAAETAQGGRKEKQKSKLSNKVRGMRTDARPRSRKTLSGEDADWEERVPGESD